MTPARTSVAATVTLMLACLALPGATPAVIDAAGAPVEGCAAQTDPGNPNLAQLVSESGWLPTQTVQVDGTVVKGMMKKFDFNFGPPNAAEALTPNVLRDPNSILETVGNVNPTVEFDNDEQAPGQGPDVRVEDCSAGVCTVQVHVYEKSTQSVKGGVGVLAFLPFFFGVGGKIEAEQNVNVTEESKIECAGTMFMTVKAMGGIGPHMAASSIVESNAKQQHRTCAYTNLIPTYDDYCDMTYTGKFELAATHPGKFTKFDVVNGGLWSNSPYYNGPSTFTSTFCTPDTPVLPPFCLGSSGLWMAKFTSIEIKVDTQEAVALLSGGGGSIL